MISPLKKRFKRVYVEISNICNLKCNFCPEVERAAHVMDRECFARTIAQVAPLTEEVCLHLMGEPLNHPHFGALVALCADYKVPVSLTSNGVLLTGERRETLLHPIVRQVNFSVHSFEANFSERDVAPYMGRIFRFTRLAFALRPDLYINYRLWDLTDPTTLSSKNALIRATIEREFSVRLDESMVDIRRRKGYRIVNRLYLSFDSRFEWPSAAAPKRSETGFCHGLSHHFGIHADGTLVPCCLDKEAVINLGNVNQTPLLEILEGSRAKGMAEGFAAGRLVEDLCQRCSFIGRFDRKAVVQGATFTR